MRTQILSVLKNEKIMTMLIKWLAIAVFLLMLTLSLNYCLLPNLSSHDDKRVLQLLLISFVLIWVILGGMSKAYDGLLWKVNIQYLAYILFALAGVSILLSNSPQHAVMEVSLFYGLFYVSQFTSSLWFEYRLKLVNYLVCAIWIGLVLYMVGFYSGYLASFLEHIPLLGSEPFFGFSHVRFFNQYQMWTLSLIYWPLLSFNKQKKTIRLFLYIALTAWWILFFASGGRGVLLAWLLAMPVTVYCYRQFSLPLLRLQLIGFITGLNGYAVLFYLLPSFMGKTDSIDTVFRYTTTGRNVLWNRAFAMIQAHKWFGVGPMHFAWYPSFNGAHPHNSVLQLAAELGLPATLIIFLLAVYGVFCWLKRFNYKTLKALDAPNLVIVLFFALVANFSYSLVDGVIVMPLSQVMMVVVIGLMMGLYNDEKKQINALRANHFVQRFFTLIVLVAIEWSVLPELLPRILGNEQLIPRGYQTVGPRFWQEGGIAH